MMNLFIDISQWQLPEWFSAGTATSTLCNLIALIVLILKQKTNTKLADNRSERQIKLLDVMVNKLSDKTVANQLSETNSFLKDAIALFEQNTKNQELANINFATFLNECFQLSNLSEENKLTLRIKFEQLFCNSSNNTVIIENLKQLQLTTEELLVSKEAEVKELKAQIIAEQEKLHNYQKPVKKTRRI